MKKSQFTQSLISNQILYQKYLEIFTNIALSRFRWDGLPDTVDPIILEQMLYFNGKAMIVYDDIMGYLVLNPVIHGGYDVYGYPFDCTGMSNYNNFNRLYNKGEFVIIYNNMLRTNSAPQIEIFVNEIWDLEQTMLTNARAHKTPVLLKANKKLRLTMLNLFKQWRGNEPMIAIEDDLDISKIGALKLDVPFIAGEMFTLISDVYNSCLSYLGVPNISYNKKERMLKDEVNRNMGGTLAARQSYQNARDYGCQKLKTVFNLDVKAIFNDYGDIDNGKIYGEREANM